LEGFKKNIYEKIFSFGGHLQISKYDIKNSAEENPISKDRLLYKQANKIENIDHIQVYSHKPALIKSKEGVSGLVLKGIDCDFDTARFNKNMLAGLLPINYDSTYMQAIAISEYLSKKMKLAMGDSAILFFVQNPPKYRKVKVMGIYQTSMEEFDEMIAFSDIKLNRKINQWPDSLVGGYEIFLKDFQLIESSGEKVLANLDYDMQMEKITDKYLQVFEWLKLLDKNVQIFLALILLVAAFNMISTLFIMIMEHTSTIGLLKAMGAMNTQIKRIFFYLGFKMALQGIIIGNVLAMVLCGIQYYFKIITLNSKTYFMPYAPIHWDWRVWLALNLLSCIVIAIVILIPINVVSNIKPVKSIKWS
jgi:lipoprotein-releasing system permease protein